MDTNTNNQNTDAPVLCKGNCGFYGSRDSGGYCSKCYKDLQRTPNAIVGTNPTTSTPIPAQRPALGTPTTTGTSALPSINLPSAVMSTPVPITTTVASPVSTSTAAVSTTPAATETAAGPKVQKNKSKCFKCKKSIGLTAIQCRCGYTFCGEHRYAEAHECTFDFKQHDRQILEKNNEKVVAAKLDKL